MHSLTRLSFATAFICIVSAERSTAQFTPSKWEMGVNVGSLIYQGDLAKSALGYTKSLKPAVGFYVSRSLNDYFALRADLVFGSIGANEGAYSSPAWRKYRDFNFHSSVTQLSAEMEYYFLGEAAPISPYIFGGIGFSFVDIKRNWSGIDDAYFGAQSGTLVGLGKDTLHKLPGLVPVIPLGLGLKYALTPQLSIHAEIMYRLTDTDYLDGFKYSGNPKTNDYFYSFTLGISYRFGHDRMSCPKVPKQPYP